MVVLLHISEHSEMDCLVSWHSKQAIVVVWRWWCNWSQGMVSSFLAGDVVKNSPTWQDNLDNQHLVPLFQSDPRFSGFPDVIRNPMSWLGAPSGHISFVESLRVAESGCARQVSEFKDHELAGLGASFVLNYTDDVLRRLVIRQVGTGRSGRNGCQLVEPTTKGVNVSLITGIPPWVS